MTRSFLPFLSGSKPRHAINIPEKLAIARVSSELNKKILSGAPFNHLLDFIFNSLNLTIPFDRIGVATIENVQGKAHLVLKWVRSKYSTNPVLSFQSKPIDGSCIEELLAHGKPRITNDLKKYYEQNPDSDAVRLILQDGIRSNLTCPLKIDGKDIGVVFFSSRKINTYTEEHVETFLELANEIALIIEYGRMRRKCSVDSLSGNLNTILHDLKSPLSVIQGFADNAEHESWFENLDPSAKEVLSIVRRNSMKMFSTLEGLLEISELNSQVDSFRPKLVNLPAFLKEIKVYGQMLCRAKEIHFDFNIDPNLPTQVYFDKEDIHRALENLFSNAIKYSPRGCHIQFKAEFSEKYLDFSVQDWGVGINPQEFPLLFKEFGKTSSRPTEGESSSGLGLAIVKKIVDLHGGQVFVSSCPGQGSKFEIRIPLIAASNP